MNYDAGEVEQIITPDGEMFTLGNAFDEAVIAIGGRGMPGVDYQVEQGYMQPWPVVRGWKLEARAIALQVVLGATDRADYWARRQRLMDHLRFNRGGPFTLRHVRGDGRRVDIRAYPDSSPVFADDFAWASTQVDIDLIAFDPLFEDTDWTIEDASVTIYEELEFPATFPILFDADVSNITLNITYTGTFVTYPVIEITGPYTWLSLTNTATGAYIKLQVAITAGEQRILDLTPGAQTLTDADGNDKFGELVLPESNLVHFNLRPAGADWQNSPFEGVTGGLNAIWVQALETNNDMVVKFRYKNRYVEVSG